MIFRFTKFNLRLANTSQTFCHYLSSVPAIRRKSTMGRIPDRWKEYSTCGKPIENVPIIAFKTPLAKKYSRQYSPAEEYVEQDNEFTPDDLVKCVNEHAYELVVVVDLTNTFRYYNGFEELGKHRIQYEKVKCEGHVVPNDGVMERVADIANDVIHRHGRDSKKVLGIHCTHGINRTGYIVARYLIEWLGYEPTNAITAVNEARGHELEREAYLEDLRNRTPGNRFAEWEQEICLNDNGNGSGDPTNLQSGFEDSDYKAPNHVMQDRTRHHPYPRMLRGNHRQHDNYYVQNNFPRPNPYADRTSNKTSDPTGFQNK